MNVNKTCGLLVALFVLTIQASNLGQNLFADGTGPIPKPPYQLADGTGPIPRPPAVLQLLSA